MVLTPDQWLERANTARTTAKLVSDPESRRLLLRIAEFYDKLAMRARLTANDER